MCNNFHTSGKNEKENMHTPRCNFLRRSSHNKLLQIFLWEKWGEGEFVWKHWEGRLTWKGKFAYTYTLLIIQCLCNNYSSTQKINEAKENNLRNKTHTCFLITMMKACELKVKHQVNSRVSLKKKVRQGSVGNVKFKKHACMLNLIFNMFV